MKMVLIEQISALIDFLESHKDLALGYSSRTNEGRNLAKRNWMECAQILNSLTVDCPNKTPAEWRTFYNEYKCKLLKKIKAEKTQISATGGGSAKKITLTPLQERLYDLLRRDVGEPLAGVRHNPLTVSAFIILECSIETIENIEAQVDDHNIYTPLLRISKDIFKVPQLEKNLDAEPAKNVPKQNGISNNPENSLIHRKDHDDQLNSFLSHMKSLKDEEHRRRLEMAEEEHSLKIAIQLEKLKSATLEREILELKKAREARLNLTIN